MSVDRREFLRRLTAGAAVLLPAALLAGCPAREETETEAPPPVDAPPPPESEGAAAETREGEEGTVPGADPAQAPEGSLTFECPKCQHSNALPGYEEGDRLPKIKCRVCGHVWQP